MVCLKFAEGSRRDPGFDEEVELLSFYGDIAPRSITQRWALPALFQDQRLPPQFLKHTLITQSLWDVSADWVRHQHSK